MIKTRVLLTTLLLALSLTNAPYAYSHYKLKKHKPAESLVQDKSALRYQIALDKALISYRADLGRFQTTILMPELMKVISYPKMSDEYREAKYQYDSRVRLWEADKRDFDRHYKWLGQHNVRINQITELRRKYGMRYNAYKPKYIDNTCNRDMKCVDAELFENLTLASMKHQYASLVKQLTKLEKKHPVWQIKMHRALIPLY